MQALGQLTQLTELQMHKLYNEASNSSLTALYALTGKAVDRNTQTPCATASPLRHAHTASRGNSTYHRLGNSSTDHEDADMKQPQHPCIFIYNPIQCRQQMTLAASHGWYAREGVVALWAFHKQRALVCKAPNTCQGMYGASMCADPRLWTCPIW